MGRITPGTPKRGGRQKGTPNRITRDVREMVREAFDELGGVAWLVKVARKKPAAFIHLLAKTIPSEIRAEIAGGATITLHVERSFVKELPEPGRAVALGSATVQVIGTGRG